MSTNDSIASSRPLMQELFASGLYKRNQGRMVRQVTCLTIWVIVAIAVWRMHSLFLVNRLQGSWTSYLIAAAVGGLGFWFAFRLVNWPKFADFLIAVEAELNKVSWPTKKELVRASIVVIFTILFLSAVLFAFDAIWRFLFGWLGIA
ncbi:MAG TPA: preprotein translocase subunit SecE [Planctomycetaceae bacterium]|nr:preprotein translocase subunit SecE [Planctomycetaceae bacterium]